MKKSLSKCRGSKSKKCLSHKNSNKGADQDIQLALALSISMLPQVQDSHITPRQKEPGFEEATQAAAIKRKRVRLDETEVPTLLVTSDQDYSASVLRRAHNLLDVSSYGTPADSNSTSEDHQDCSLWNLASLSELELDQEFVVELLRNSLPMDTAQKPDITADSYTLLYNSGLPIMSSILSNYLFNPFLSDTVLVTKDSHKIPSHLFILAAHSALIRDLIAERYNMKRILMRGHEVHTVVPLLEFMYLGKFQFESIHLEVIKKLASTLQMDAFLTCLEEHQRIANPVQKQESFVEAQLSQENVHTESKPPTSLPELFSKVKKDCSAFEIS